MLGRALHVRRPSASRTLALVHVKLALQVTCARKRKPIRRAPLDVPRSRSSRRLAQWSSRSLHAARASDGAKFHHDAPRSTALRVRDVRPAVSLPSVTPTREQGGSLRREVSAA